MKVQRKIAVGVVVASSLLLLGGLFEFISAPSNAVSAAAMLKRSWQGEQTLAGSSLVSALLNAAVTSASLDAAAGSSCLDIRHQLQLQQHAFCL